VTLLWVALFRTPSTAADLLREFDRCREHRIAEIGAFGEELLVDEGTVLLESVKEG
jgi:hypothetical protein